MTLLKYIIGTRYFTSSFGRLLLPTSMSPTFQPISRFSYISEAFHCKPAWEKRLQSPILLKVSVDDLFYAIDKKYQSDQLISAIDVDLYVNKVDSGETLDEVEELLHRLRKSPATADTLDSTSHAVIRLFLKFAATESLMRILNDRMNYGVFIDFFTANLLMDDFLNKGNCRDAAKVSSLLMLEEDFSQPTSKMFALLSCLKYLENPVPEIWDPDVAPVDEKKDKEETKFRIPYLRNAFYDFHFDLNEPNVIIGKTLLLISRQLNEDDILKRSVEILGNVHYNRWENVLALLKMISNSKLAVAEETIKKTTEILDIRIAEIQASPTQSLAKPKIVQYPGVNLDQKDIDFCWSKIKLPDYKPILQEIKSLLSTNAILIDKNFNLISKTEELLKKAISENESLEMKIQCKAYEEWEEIRMIELQNQLERFRKDKVIRDIEQTKQELQEKEDVIFFFDNEEEWMMKQPPGALDKYTLSFKYVPQNSIKFVRTIPVKKIKKKKIKV